MSLLAIVESPIMKIVFVLSALNDEMASTARTIVRIVCNGVARSAIDFLIFICFML